MHKPWIKLKDHDLLLPLSGQDPAKLGGIIQSQSLLIRCLLIFIFCFGLADAFAQDNKTETPVQEISTKLEEVEPLKQKLILSSFIEIPTHSILISTDAGRVNDRQATQRIQYNPTFGPNLGVRGEYNFWSLALSKRLSFLSEADEQKYGRSNYDDWRIGYSISKRFLVEAYYQNYHGFYADLSGQEGLQTSVNSKSDSGSSESASRGESEIVNRPDISALNYGIRATYALPLRPFLGIFGQFADEKNPTTWELNFLTKMYYNRLSITADQPLVPASTANAFSPVASLKEYWSNTLGAGAGLGVVVFASPESTAGFDAILGAGFQRQTNIFMDHESVAYTTAQEVNANMYFDWKGTTNGFRFALYWDTYSAKVEDINFDTSSLGVNLIYSYRGLSL